MNFHSLISQLSDNEKKELFELIQKKYAVEPKEVDFKKFETIIYIDRNKLLDDAVFIAICGLEQIRAELSTTGKVRLEIARAKLDRVIKKLEKDGY